MWGASHPRHWRAGPVKHNLKHQNEQLAIANAHFTLTKSGSCWLRRTGQETSKHTAAGGQRSDSDPQHFSSTGSSPAEAAVLQGGRMFKHFKICGMRCCQGWRGLQKSHPVKHPVRSRIQISCSAQTQSRPLRHKRQHITQDHTSGSRACNV